MKNNSPPTREANDPLDSLLRDADEYLGDNGFTARVVSQLPPRRRRTWRRLAVLSVALLLGVSLAAWQWPAIFLLMAAALQPSAWLQWQTIFGVLLVLAALAALVWGLLAVANAED